MPVTPNKASLAKTLFIIMLVVFSTMEMATAVGLPEDTQVSDTLHVDHTPLALRQKRYLRSAADVKSSDRSSSVKVKRLLFAFDKLRAGFGKSVSAANSYFQAKALQYKHQQQTPRSVFTYLQLDNMEQNPFDSSNFYTWVLYVKATTRTKETATAEMSRTLWDTFPRDHLITLLGGVKASHKFGNVAKDLREHQMGILANIMTAERAFIYLGLDKVSKDELIGSPEFTMWGAFMIKGRESYYNAFKCLERRLDEKKLLTALTAIHDNNENRVFAQSLIFGYFWNLRIKGVKPVKLYEDLDLAELPFELSEVSPLQRPKAIVDSLLKDPLRRMWFDYVYVYSYLTSSIDKFKVKVHLNEVFGKNSKTKGLKATKDLKDSERRISQELTKVVSKEV